MVIVREVSIPNLPLLATNWLVTPVRVIEGVPLLIAEMVPLPWRAPRVAFWTVAPLDHAVDWGVTVRLVAPMAVTVPEASAPPPTSTAELPTAKKERSVLLVRAMVVVAVGVALVTILPLLPTRTNRGLPLVTP